MKYDLSIDRAPILSIIVEDNAGCGICNKENHSMTIRMAILSEGLYTSTLDDVMSMNKHGESYLDYTWNGSFRDVCKHVHAVLTYFKDKQRVLPSSNKNLLIYNGSVAYQEIIRLYNLQGNLIFNSNERPTNHINEPFRPNDQILVH
ncbi:uncharacterized protein OCT59_002490 [Rhizophagus irregularis]|uniref:uncharacterized protein n=1 Tax=Rhizophagus irregularis TaxID=588596 RepID=UPI003329E1A3|nr:hypothetical protein OCT59_002490 [Rhizophagus irregularis]